LDGLAVLVIYIDGIVVDGHHILAAIGVDEAGDKHLLGLRACSSTTCPFHPDRMQ
jgi:hypothetical protein